MKKILIVFLMMFLVIVSCTKKSETSTESVPSISINLGPEPKTMDPTLNSINVVSSYILHAFELLKA